MSDEAKAISQVGASLKFELEKFPEAWWITRTHRSAMGEEKAVAYRVATGQEALNNIAPFIAVADRSAEQSFADEAGYRHLQPCEEYIPEGAPAYQISVPQEDIGNSEMLAEAFALCGPAAGGRE